MTDSDKSWWVGWKHEHELPAFELDWPWWETGIAPGNVRHICAAVRAPAPLIALMEIQKGYPEGTDLGFEDFRFCEPRPEGWSPFCERFPRADWMDWAWGREEPTASERGRAKAIFKVGPWEQYGLQERGQAIAFIAHGLAARRKEIEEVRAFAERLAPLVDGLDAERHGIETELDPDLRTWVVSIPWRKQSS